MWDIPVGHACGHVAGQLPTPVRHEEFSLLSADTSYCASTPTDPYNRGAAVTEVVITQHCDGIRHDESQATASFIASFSLSAPVPSSCNGRELCEDNIVMLGAGPRHAVRWHAIRLHTRGLGLHRASACGLRTSTRCERPPALSRTRAHARALPSSLTPCRVRGAALGQSGTRRGHC